MTQKDQFPVPFMNKIETNYCMHPAICLYICIFFIM